MLRPPPMCRVTLPLVCCMHVNTTLSTTSGVLHVNILNTTTDVLHGNTTLSTTTGVLHVNTLNTTSGVLHVNTTLSTTTGVLHVNTTLSTTSGVLYVCYVNIFNCRSTLCYMSTPPLMLHGNTNLISLLILLTGHALIVD